MEALNAAADDGRDPADEDSGELRRLREANEELWATNSALGTELSAIRAALADRARPVAALRAGTAPAGSLLAALARERDEEAMRHQQAEYDLRLQVELLEHELGRLRTRERELEAGLQQTIALRDHAGHERDETRRALEAIKSRAVVRLALRFTSRRRR